jgi:hypothetical protein
MPHNAFHSLLSALHPALVLNSDQGTRSSGGVVEPASRLAITLRILAGSSYLDLVTLFRIGKLTLYEVFHATVDVLNKRLRMP